MILLNLPGDEFSLGKYFRNDKILFLVDSIQKLS